MLENMYIVYSPIEKIQNLIEESDDLIVGTLTFIYPDEVHMMVDFISSNAPVVCHIETWRKEEDLENVNEIEVDEEDVGTWLFCSLKEEGDA